MLWYVDAKEEVRRKRLKENRGYSDEKIDGILRSQLLASEYKKSCSRVIENNGALTEAFGQIREAMR